MKNMKKSSIIIIALAVIVITIIWIGSSNNAQNSQEIYHISLSESKYNKYGIFVDEFAISSENCQRYCNYKFTFVPNGDSPQTLSISIIGETVSFSEDFQLVGTSVNSDISQYYTWDYEGEKYFENSGSDRINIEINPHRNMKGTVSVYIIQE
jgi:hypothetical protein